MAYRLLALDLDGTLIGPDLVIPAEVKTGIAGLLQRGITVTLATGRMFAATMPFAEQLGIKGPLICYQGAMVRDASTKQIMAHFPMPAELAAEAATILMAEDIFVVAYIDERLCVAAKRPELDIYLRYHPHHVEVVIDPNLPDLIRQQPPTKLLFVAEPEVVGPALAQLAKRFEGQLGSTRSHAIFGELTALGVSKGVALEALAAQLGIAREEVVAIGDQENDLSMISWAGLGLAMGNAIPEAKAIARAVLPSVEEAGVAYAIREYF